MKTATLLAMCVFVSGFARGNSTKIADSKSGAYSVVQAGPIYGDQGWETSVTVKATGQKLPLWRSVRPVEVHWSDDEHWLVIEDSLMRLSSVVLVYQIDKSQARCVYQSPYSPSNFDIFFRFQGWLEKANKLAFKQEIAVTDRNQTSLVSVIELSPKMESVVPNAYFETEQNYGQIKGATQTPTKH